jgi:hypothetical protein
MEFPWELHLATGRAHLCHSPRHGLHLGIGGLPNWVSAQAYDIYIYPWRIHGAGIYANMTGVYW